MCDKFGGRVNEQGNGEEISKSGVELKVKEKEKRKKRQIEKNFCYGRLSAIRQDLKSILPRDAMNPRY